MVRGVTACLRNLKTRCPLGSARQFNIVFENDIVEIADENFHPHAPDTGDRDVKSIDSPFAIAFGACAAANRLDTGARIPDGDIDLLGCNGMLVSIRYQDAKRGTPIAHRLESD